MSTAAPAATADLAAGETRSSPRPGRFLADLLTAGNAACGLVSIYFSLLPFYLLAGAFLLFAMLFDGLDGLAARRFGSWHSKGHLVDTTADMVTMAAAPGILAWSALTRIAPDLWWLAIVASSAYVACAVARLVNYARRGHKQKEFSGMPSPAGMLMVLMLVFLLGPTPFLAQQPLWIGIAIAAFSPLMVAPVPYPKLRGRWVLPLAVAGAAVGVPAIYLYLTTYSYDSPFVKAGAVLSLAYLIGYALSGPAVAAVDRLRAGAPT